MTGRAYRQSAELAKAVGPYEKYEENAEPHLRVMRKHRDAAYAMDEANIKDKPLLDAARKSWDEAVALGEQHGYRNAQATVLAPTGTISFLMDCDTTGIEPDFSLVKYKELVGGGSMTIVNRTVPLALKTLGYKPQEIEQIEAYINEHGTIVGAPGLNDVHLPVFDVAVGARAISAMGHVKMMGATQPFLSGAISKTVNMPNDATIEDIQEAYTEAWRLGVKALAIYRDGSKTAQALRTDAQDEKDAPAGAGQFTQDDLDAAVQAAVAAAMAQPHRRRMPRERQSITHKFSVGGHEGYITAGLYEDGSVGEIFLTDVGKEGSTMRGMMNAFATPSRSPSNTASRSRPSSRSSPTCASSPKASPRTPRSPSPSPSRTTSCAGSPPASSAPNTKKPSASAPPPSSPKTPPPPPHPKTAATPPAPRQPTAAPRSKSAPPPPP